MIVRTDDPRLGALIEPGSHGSWRSYLGRLWDRRAYIWHVPWNELRSQQMNTVLGNLWHLFNPLLSIAVYALVFGVLLDVSRGVETNFVAFLAVGVFVYGFTQKAALAGAQSIERNQGLVRSINFPRALLPITTVITELLAFVPGVLVILITAMAAEEPPRWTWLLLPLIVVVHAIFNVGIALLAARASSSFGDVKNVLPFVFRLLFYGSGVLYSVETFITDDRQRMFFVPNPLYDLIQLYRWAVLDLEIVWTELASLGAWTVCVTVGGLIWFRQGEATYGG